jgi:hypothetical protein
VSSVDARKHSIQVNTMISAAEIANGDYETTHDHTARLVRLPILSVDQVAALIGVPISTLEQQLTRQRSEAYAGPRLRSFRIGRRRFFRHAALLQWALDMESVEMGGPA